MPNRREILAGTVLFPVVSSLSIPGKWLQASQTSSLASDLLTSRLIYLTPLKTDGSESQCQGEVWFVFDGAYSIYVNTQYDAWRANAIRRGLTQARIWVGEFGLWRSTDVYRDAPSTVLSDGKIVEDVKKHDEVFPIFGKKYADEWPVWGPRFKSGLLDGSRSLLKYEVSL